MGGLVAPRREGRKYGFSGLASGGVSWRSVWVSPMVFKRAWWELRWSRAKMWQEEHVSVDDVMLHDRQLVKDGVAGCGLSILH